MHESVLWKLYLCGSMYNLRPFSIVKSVDFWVFVTASHVEDFTA
jgi:hypothetical protein